MAVGDVYPYQIKPDELYGILQPQFQARAEPNFAWKSAVSALMGLPGLRCAWPMNMISSTPTINDIVQGRSLMVVSNGVFDVDNLVSYFEGDGSADYAYHADVADFDITDTEAWVPSAAQGLTLGGWFYFNTATVANVKGLEGKWTSIGNQRSYLLYHEQTNDNIYFAVSDDGTSVAASPASIIPTVDIWYFLVGRYTTTNQNVELLINDTWYTSAATTETSVNNSTARFEIHSYENGTASTLWDGRSSLLFLCQRSVPDSNLLQFYHQTRSMYGV